MEPLPNSLNTNLTKSETFSYKDILVGKLAKAVACSVISQLLILVIYTFLANISIFHPAEWISAALNTFTYVSTWLFVFIFLSIIFAQCIICAKDYVLMTSYSSTRFQQFLHILSLHNFMLLTLHTLIGGALVWQILSLVEGNNRDLIVLCDNGPQYCLVPDSFFLIIGGFWIGIYYFLKVYVSSKYLVFPVIQQKKFLQFRTNIFNIFKESFKIALWPTLYFSILYYIWGNRLEGQFISTFGLDTQQHESSILVYLYSWWFSTLYIFSMNLMRFFFYLFLTESFKFPLIKENMHILTLQEALLMNNLPIIQNLACLDLFLLSQWSPQRRQIFFTLSQPGAHPHNWNSLIESLLKLFNDYTDLLKKSTDNSLIQDKPKTASEICTPFTPIRLQSPISSSDSRFRNLRNMSYYADQVDVVNVSHNMPNNEKIESLKKIVLEKFDKIISFLKVFLGINFLFGELPQVNIQKCLGNGHLISWASQGIAEMTAASLTEDKYGIVQKDLPVVITTLVQLKQNLDKLNKISALSRRISGFDDFNYKMKNSVSAAVKRSLLNICLHFGEYFKDFPLSPDVLQYLQINVMLKNCG